MDYIQAEDCLIVCEEHEANLHIPVVDRCWRELENWDILLDLNYLTLGSLDDDMSASKRCNRCSPRQTPPPGINHV